MADLLTTIVSDRSWSRCLSRESLTWLRTDTTQLTLRLYSGGPVRGPTAVSAGLTERSTNYWFKHKSVDSVMRKVHSQSCHWPSRRRWRWQSRGEGQVKMTWHEWELRRPQPRPRHHWLARTDLRRRVTDEVSEGCSLSATTRTVVKGRTEAAQSVVKPWTDQYRSRHGSKLIMAKVRQLKRWQLEPSSVSAARPQRVICLA